jgi:hypothetical protein
MCLDAGQVLKRAVLCRHCNEDYLFTLRAIAEQSELICPACRNSIAIRDHAYEPLVSDVRNLLTAMDSVPTYFMSPRHADYGRPEVHPPRHQ